MGLFYSSTFCCCKYQKPDSKGDFRKEGHFLVPGIKYRRGCFSQNKAAVRQPVRHVVSGSWLCSPVSPSLGGSLCCCRLLSTLALKALSLPIRCTEHLGTWVQMLQLEDWPALLGSTPGGTVGGLVPSKSPGLRVAGGVSHRETSVVSAL